MLQKINYKLVNITLLIALSLLLVTKFFMDFKMLYLDAEVQHYQQTLLKLVETASSITPEIVELGKQNTFNSKIVVAYNSLNSSAKLLGTPSNSDMLAYSELIVRESIKYNIDPMLVLGIIHTESAFMYDVVSHKGAIGLMQILPATAFDISNQIKYSQFSSHHELFNIETNLKLGIAYFAYLVKKTGSTDRAIIAYNFGIGNLKRSLNANKELPKVYLSKVKRNHERYTNKFNNVYGLYAQLD